MESEEEVAGPLRRLRRPKKNIGEDGDVRVCSCALFEASGPVKPAGSQKRGEGKGKRGYICV